MIYMDRTHRLWLVIHTVGNIAEFLVSSGLARVVDWHAGMLAAGGGMERLRAAERQAKEKHLKLYANALTPSTVKSNGTVSNGNTRNFDGIVTRVWSGDQLSVVEKDGSKERRIQLSSTRAPKSVFPTVVSNVGLTVDIGHQIPGRRSTHRRLVNSCARNSSASMLKCRWTSSVPRKAISMSGNALPYTMATRTREYLFPNVVYLRLTHRL